MTTRTSSRLGRPRSTPLPRDGRNRVVIEGFSPAVDEGQFPAKRVLGDRVTLEVDLICDGHDRLGGAVHCRAPDGTVQQLRLQPVVNDRWQAVVELTAIGTWSFEVTSWIDAFETWRYGLERKVEAGQDVGVELLEGAAMVRAAVARADVSDREPLEQVAARLADTTLGVEARITDALSTALAQRMARSPDRSQASTAGPYEIVVDPTHARFSAWYELFPRSCGPRGEHGTLRDAANRLDYVADLGFDIVYLPPIHPIGRTNRKGPNNSLDAGPDAVGSPWAIGAAEGGHTSVHPALGTLDDFDAFVAAAGGHGLRVSLDIAFQCSPDHPWVTEHPQWFRQRPDGTIQYAENPPKKYQDVYPFDFDCDDWPALWAALRDVFLFWAERGVLVFRVDNPHTKPLPFWQWCLAEVKARHPDAIFLSEAFTRPKLMNALAKVGFSQSYTYFTWRNTKYDLQTYVEQLVRPPVCDYFRPNFWPNTPDILPEELQWGGRAAFVTRLVLAATLSSNYGIYGPAYELMESRPRPGSGEYLDNEKYQLRQWDLDRSDSLRGVIKRVNEIRRESPALHQTTGVRFHDVDNDLILCFSKHAEDDSILVVANLDHHHRQSGWVHLDLASLGVDPSETYQVHDLLGGGRYLWSGPHNYVELDPHGVPAHIFRIRRRIRTERDFDYFV